MHSTYVLMFFGGNARGEVVIRSVFLRSVLRWAAQSARQAQRTASTAQLSPRKKNAAVCRTSAARGSRSLFSWAAPEKGKAPVVVRKFRLHAVQDFNKLRCRRLDFIQNLGGSLRARKGGEEKPQ